MELEEDRKLDPFSKIECKQNQKTYSKRVAIGCPIFIIRIRGDPFKELTVMIWWNMGIC
jgi:hypothetical protein